jgi:glutamate-ammonia-ligase adenylyltransferase
MMDIELLAQTVALQAASPARGVERQIAAGETKGKLSHSDQTALLDAYRLFWQVQAASKLLSDKPLDPDTLGLGGRAFLLREVGAVETEAGCAALTERLARKAALAERVISAHLNG